MGSVSFDIITYLKGEVKVWKIRALRRDEYISLQVYIVYFVDLK